MHLHYKRHLDKLEALTHPSYLNGDEPLKKNDQKLKLSIASLLQLNMPELVSARWDELESTSKLYPTPWNTRRISIVSMVFLFIEPHQA